MENAPAMYEEADDESREWEGFLHVLHEIFYGGAFTVEYEGRHDGTLRLYESVKRARSAVRS